MAQDRKSHSPAQPEAVEVETSFPDLFNKSEELLRQLRIEVTSGKGILDPNTQKKRELLAKLKFIIDQLHQDWEALHPEKEKKQAPQDALDPLKQKISIMEKIDADIAKAKIKLTSAMKQLKNIIISIAALTIGTEAASQKEIDQFNITTENLNEQILALKSEYALLEANTKHIAKFEYGKKLADYMNLATGALNGLTTVGLAWFITFGKAVETAGSIFYPISAAFTGLASLVNFVGRTAQFFIASNELDKHVHDEIRKLELENTKALLQKSALFQFLAFALSILGVLALAGVLASPLGWAFMAGATLVDWIDGALRTSQLADEAVKKFEKENGEKIKEGNSDIIDQLKELQAEANQAKSEARWGFVTTVAMILFACSPIPVVGPFMGLVGLALFGAVALRNGYIAAKPYVEKYFAPQEPQKDYQETLSLEEKNENGLKKELRADGPAYIIEMQKIKKPKQDHQEAPILEEKEKNESKTKLQAQDPTPIQATKVSKLLAVKASMTSLTLFRKAGNDGSHPLPETLKTHAKHTLPKNPIIKSRGG